MNSKKRIGIQMILLNLIIIILTIVIFEKFRKDLDKLILIILPMYVLLNGIFIFVVFTINENYYKKNIFNFNLWKMPNQNYLKTISKNYFKGDKFLLLSIVLANHEELIKIFDEPFFYKVMEHLMNRFKDKIKNKNVIISNNIRRIMIIIEGRDHLEYLRIINDILNEQIYIESIPIILEYNIGYYLKDNLNNLYDESLFLECYIASKYACLNDIQVVNFDDIDDDHQHDYNLLKLIPQAIKNEELIFHYQPIIPMKKEPYLYLEMLIRWELDGSLIMPIHFIPQVEETPLINDVSLYVVKAAIKEINRYLKMGYKVAMSINVSSKNLISDEFIYEIIKLIKDSKLDPYHFELEITEGSAIYFTEGLIKNILKLEELGVKVSIDDFGTGFSSMGYFDKMPIDFVKIDRALTKNIDKDEKANSLVKNIIILLHDLGYGVVAEGVETKEQYDILIKNNVDYIQGYYISLPLDNKDAEIWTKNNYEKFVK